MSVSKNTIEKIGHRACLREMTGQTYSIYASTSTYFTVHFSVAGGKGFQSKSLKKQERYKVWSVRNNLIYNLWKNHVILIEIENFP